MFTGIVTAIGEIKTVEPKGDWRCTIISSYPAGAIALGASISCSGVCLTVVAREADAAGSRFSVDISEETRRATSLGKWTPGTKINLERSLRVGDEIGGHIVLGHVDGVGRIEQQVPENNSLRLRISAPAELLPLIAPKGSIAVDGVSLTVNAVGPGWFELNIIPHTATMTTLGQAATGQSVNLEADVLARYVARLRSAA